MIYAMHAEYIEMIQLCIICIISNLVGLNIISINSYNWRLAYKVLRDSLRKSWFNLNPIHPPPPTQRKIYRNMYLFVYLFDCFYFLNLSIWFFAHLYVDILIFINSFFFTKNSSLWSRFCLSNIYNRLSMPLKYNLYLSVGLSR